MAAVAPAPQTSSNRSPTTGAPATTAGQGSADALTQSVRGMDYDAGRQAVRPTTPVTPFSAAERQVVADAVATGQTDENDLTDLVFFGRYPEMEGTCADPASAEGKEWVILRDQLVRPVVKAASKTQAQSTGAATPPGDGESGADAAGGAQSGSSTAAVAPVSSTTDDVALPGTTGASALNNGRQATTEASGTYDYKPAPESLHTICSSKTAFGMDAATIKKDTTVNDPSNLGTALALPADGLAPTGTFVYKTALRIKKATPIQVLDFDPSGRYAQVQVAGATYWVEGSTITYTKAPMQPPFEAPGMRTIGTGKEQVAILQINGANLFVPVAGNFDTFDLTYASAVPGQTDAMSQTGMAKDSSAAARAFNTDTKTADNNAAEFHNNQASATGKVVSLAAGTEYGDDGKSLGKKVDSPGVTLAEKVIDAKTTLVQVQLFSGAKTWVAKSNVKSWGAAFRWSIENRPEGLTFVKARDPNIVGEEKTAYPIDPGVAALIKDQATAQADALLEKQTYTPKQKELLAMADAFKADPKLGAGRRTFGVPGTFMEQDGETLSMDLVGRLQEFYKFCQYAQIVTAGAPAVSSGIRGRPTAHKMSVHWMLNDNSGLLKTDVRKNSFAQAIVDINGLDPSSGDTWADAAQVGRFSEALGKLGSEATKAEAQLEINTVTAEIQKSKGKTGAEGKEKWKQGATAIEGYPTSMTDMRKPNVSDCSVSNHCGGEAMDITFPFVMNYYDPIVDAVALKFGLYRPVKDSSNSPEHWHYERVGG